MKLIALMPVRNAGHVLGMSLRVALQWCDAVMVLLHECTDDSEAIVKQAAIAYGDRISVLTEAGPWDEMWHRQILLERARGLGASHIAIVDSDEVLTRHLTSTIRPIIDELHIGQMLMLPLYNLRDDEIRYHADGLWGNRSVSVAFRDSAQIGWSGDKFHSREPAGVCWTPCEPIEHGLGGVLHFWGDAPARQAAHHALYKLTERLRWPDKPVAEIDRMYSLWLTADTGRRCEVPFDWHHVQLEHFLDLDRTPWETAECRRIIAEHSGIDAGLDLFGVV